MKGTRKASRKNANQMGGRKKTRKATPWNKFVQKIYREMKGKMGKKASFSMALKEASRRKSEM